MFLLIAADNSDTSGQSWRLTWECRIRHTLDTSFCLFLKGGV